MRHSIVGACVAVAVVAAVASLAGRVVSAAVPSVVAVRQLDLGYRLGEGGLKIRATLATGEAIEYSTSDTRDAQMILDVAQACGSGAALSAVVEANALRAIQCSITRRFP